MEKLGGCRVAPPLLPPPYMHVSAAPSGTTVVLPPGGPLARNVNRKPPTPVNLGRVVRCSPVLICDEFKGAKGGGKV